MSPRGPSELTPRYEMRAEGCHPCRVIGLPERESGVAFSAAAQLLPLLDYAYLDGSALLAKQPAQGFQPEWGSIAPLAEYGCEVVSDPGRI